MKKISNEVKVGAVALITILAFIWLYNFLKGKDLFSPYSTYYVMYDEIGGLTETNPVEINGYQAGVVQSIDFINDKTGRLLVKLSIEKDFILPEKTVAEITTATLIAGMKIRLLFGEGEGAYKSGDTIPGRLATSVLAQFQDELVPLKNKMETMVTTLDSVLSGIGDVLTPEFKKNLRGSMANLNHATGSIDQMVSSRESGLKKMVEDLSVFSKMLAENSDKLSGTIGNLETITDTLAAADLYPTLMNLKATLENTAVLIEGMNEGKGTTGKLFTDDSLYTNLNSSIRSLDILLQDIQAQPKRYVHFSLFGKKDKPTK